VRTTIEPELQRAAELALQDGLARYEQNTGRVNFHGAEANLGDAIRRIEQDPKADPGKPAWLQALEQARPPLYDVHWATAVVVEKVRLKGGVESIRVGLRDGRVLPLSTHGARTRQNIAVHDLLYVNLVETKSKQGTGIRVDLRVRPTVQGAVVVLENRTGRILAMAGGFSYPLSQLNRASQSRRQPGSAFKPMTYLAALASGLQPNTLIQDEPITLPPIGDARYAQIKDYWSPKNYDGGYSGTMTLRRALENSKNLVTARLLAGGVADTPEQSLDRICRLAVELQLYPRCERYYPFVLGAQPVRPIDLATFYATVANEGVRPQPYAIESIEQDGKVVYRNTTRPEPIGAADRPAFFQLRSILQGVLARGTGRSIGALAPYVAGKTGTSDEENDAWFVGFTNDVTVAVWVGYDNAGTRRRTLGPGQTGSRVAIPIFVPVMEAVWQHHAEKAPLRGPSPEAARQLIALPIDVRSGERVNERSNTAFREYFRLDATGRLTDTQYRMASRYDYHPPYSSELSGDRPIFDPWFRDRRRDYDAPHYVRPPQPQPFFFPFFGGIDDRRQADEERIRQEQWRQRQWQQQQQQQQYRQRRVEPEPRRGDPFWGNRRF
jgi:membrane carboxypeptidase/penicillin-binding protein